MNRNILPPLPSLDDLFNAPCPFSLTNVSTTPVKTEQPPTTGLGDVASAAVGRSSPVAAVAVAKFEQISDDEAGNLEPAAKRHKANMVGTYGSSCHQDIDDILNRGAIYNSAQSTVMGVSSLLEDFLVQGGNHAYGDHGENVKTINFDHDFESSNSNRRSRLHSNEEHRELRNPKQTLSREETIDSPHNNIHQRRRSSRNVNAERGIDRVGLEGGEDGEIARENLFDYFSQYAPTAANISATNMVTGSEDHGDVHSALNRDVLDLLGDESICPSHSTQFDIPPVTDYVLPSASGCLSSFGYDSLRGISAPADRLIGGGNFLDPDEFLSSVSAQAAGVDADLDSAGSTSWIGGGSADSSGEFITGLSEEVLVLVPVPGVDSPKGSQEAAVALLPSNVPEFNGETAIVSKTLVVNPKNDAAKETQETAGEVEKHEDENEDEEVDEDDDDVTKSSEATLNGGLLEDGSSLGVENGHTTVIIALFFLINFMQYIAMRYSWTHFFS